MKTRPSDRPLALAAGLTPVVQVKPLSFFPPPHGSDLLEAVEKEAARSLVTRAVNAWEYSR